MLANGHDTAVLTDINNSTCSIDFIRKGQKKGVNVLAGMEFRQDHLIKIEDKFIDHCKKQGYPEQTSREIWRQMESFAGYSFNKANSASFAVESYQSLYRKTYFPLEFMVSVLNNYGGFYSRKVYVNEARVAGANICLPCINRSEYLTIIQGRDIYLGFDGMQHFEPKQAESIINERHQNGSYTSLPQFVKRTGIANPNPLEAPVTSHTLFVFIFFVFDYDTNLVRMEMI